MEDRPWECVTRASETFTRGAELFVVTTGIAMRWRLPGLVKRLVSRLCTYLFRVDIGIGSRPILPQFWPPRGARIKRRPDCGWDGKLRSLVESQSVRPVHMPLRICDSVRLLPLLVDMARDEAAAPGLRTAAFNAALSVLSHLPTDVQVAIEPGVLAALNLRSAKAVAGDEWGVTSGE